MPPQRFDSFWSNRVGSQIFGTQHWLWEQLLKAIKIVRHLMFPSFNVAFVRSGTPTRFAQRRESYGAPAFVESADLGSPVSWMVNCNG